MPHVGDHIAKGFEPLAAELALQNDIEVEIDKIAAVSIAESLKRIADALEKIDYHGRPVAMMDLLQKIADRGC